MEREQMKTIGVIGAGVMGAGVAQSVAQAGFRVIVVDIDRGAFDRASAEIANGLRMRALFDRKAQRERAETIRERISFTDSIRQLASADFVVENAVEKWDVKREIYADLDATCPAHCVFAANTSVISITQIAGATRRPAQVIGIHFMNPVPLKPAVEVIRGFHTSDSTVAIANELLEAMGKRSILVNDSPGFVSNRVLMLTINEAVNLLQEGVASAEQVDDIFESCFSHKMGPLVTADLIGLDTILLSLEGLLQGFGDPKFRPSTLLRKMVSAGLLGRKSGAGFFRYDINAASSR